MREPIGRSSSCLKDRGDCRDTGQCQPHQTSMQHEDLHAARHLTLLLSVCEMDSTHRELPPICNISKARVSRTPVQPKVSLSPSEYSTAKPQMYFSVYTTSFTTTRSHLTSVPSYVPSELEPMKWQNVFPGTGFTSIVVTRSDHTEACEI